MLLGSLRQIATRLTVSLPVMTQEQQGNPKGET